ncbi:hypothetical protein [Streptococcus saliviloxodontae]|uniref:Uncharacterized protein n=1 Tax=Streptococcus saliviloxodontae TaxID=1349416 RepID=A0ABS2PJC0_9STRE|nr:hypothetical protein [Streptococcus saliviloxodontae]MBM7635529.1 hypothetical protein [Streptococcus saliviloxodontae]
MIGNNMKKLIIVCDDKTEKYANFLRQLISLKDDTEDEVLGIKDGTVDVVVWKEKHYSDNMATISSKVHILFLGNGKVSKNEFNSSMKMYYDQFGMTYGWLGNRGVIRVTTGIEDEEEYNKFAKLYSGYGLNFEKIDFRNFSKTVADTVDKKANGLFSKNKFSKAAIAAGGLVADVAVGGIVGGTVVSVYRQKKMKQQQYQTLIVAFYREGLAKFLEE